MSTIVINHSAIECRYPSDCQRIKKAFEEEGIIISIVDAETLWDMHSDGSAAGWLFLPHDHDLIVPILRPYFTEVPS